MGTTIVGDTNLDGCSKLGGGCNLRCGFRLGVESTLGGFSGMGSGMVGNGTRGGL